uniref:Putative secreted peptide n=1 Tax=Anopheles braziliensis TaxID=58242 RepID=A0A2M3ZNB3_9DIPT
MAPFSLAFVCCCWPLISFFLLSLTLSHTRALLSSLVHPSCSIAPTHFCCFRSRMTTTTTTTTRRSRLTSHHAPHTFFLYRTTPHEDRVSTRVCLLTASTSTSHSRRRRQNGCVHALPTPCTHCALHDTFSLSVRET